MPKVMIVDDTAMDRRRAGAILEKVDEHDPVGDRYDVVFAISGKDALAEFRHGMPDLILTDLMMPEMNGLDLVRAVREHHPQVPVILMTAHGSEDIAAAALQVGAAGYVPKRHLARDLRETVASILAITQGDREQRQVVECLAHAESAFVLKTDQTMIGPMVNFFQANLKRLGLCDYVDELRVTIALREALVNAIVHGNLEVSSDLRGEDDMAYYRLLEQRRQTPPYRDRVIHVSTRESLSEVRYVIRDEGPGFDYRGLPDPTDPANFEKPSGRGLCLIRTFMDAVAHNESGNEITMIKRRKAMAPANGSATKFEAGVG